MQRCLRTAAANTRKSVLPTWGGGRSAIVAMRIWHVPDKARIQTITTQTLTSAHLEKRGAIIRKRQRSHTPQNLSPSACDSSTIFSRFDSFNFNISRRSPCDRTWQERVRGNQIRDFVDKRGTTDGCHQQNIYISAILAVQQKGGWIAYVIVPAQSSPFPASTVG